MFEARPVIGWEKFFIGGRIFLQLAMKLSDPSKKDHVLSKIEKSVSSLHHATDGKVIYRVKTETPVFKLPDNVTDMEKLCEIMGSQYTRPMDQALASVGANKDTIVLNVNHLAGDGGFLQQIFAHLRDDCEIDYIPSIIPGEKYLEKEILSYTDKLPDFNTQDPLITRFISRNPSELYISHSLLTNGAQSRAEDLMTYKLNGKLTKLTEYYWSNFILAACAYNGSLDTTACATCVNMRPYISPSTNLSCTNCFAHATASAKVSKDDTVESMMTRLRESYNFNLKRKQPFGELKLVQQGLPDRPQIPGVGLDLSLIGSFKTGGLFKDAWVHLSQVDSSVAGIVSYLGFSVDKGHEHIFHGRMRHSSATMSDRDAEMFVRNIHFGLENIKPSIKVGEALDMFKDNQRSLFKQIPKDFRNQ